jgi:hypothetical protein
LEKFINNLFSHKTSNKAAFPQYSRISIQIHRQCRIEDERVERNFVFYLNLFSTDIIFRRTILPHNHVPFLISYVAREQMTTNVIFKFRRIECIKSAAGDAEL